MCNCDDIYVGTDCSHEKSTPPSNLTLPEQGVCKTSKRACAKTNIFGYFVTQTVFAKLDEFKVIKKIKLLMRVQFLSCQMQVVGLNLFYCNIITMGYDTRSFYNLYSHLPTIIDKQIFHIQIKCQTFIYKYKDSK